MATKRINITAKDFEKEKQKILALLAEEVKPFEDTSKDAIRRRRAQGKTDILWFAETYLPHYIEYNFAPFHKELLECCQYGEAGKAITPVLYMVPRGFGKSTIVSFIDTLHDILYGLCNFTILGSDTEDLPISFIKAMLLEIENNARIKCDFKEEASRIESKSGENLVINNCCVMAGGRRGATRGWKFRQYRPQKIKLDDMENDEHVNQPKNATKIINWIKKVCIPSLAPKKGALIWIGTNISNRSAIHRVYADKEEKKWKKIKRKALESDTDGNYISLWSEAFSVEFLLGQQELLGTKNFGSEYQNEPLDDNENFKKEWFVRFPYVIKAPSIDRYRAGFCDPSLGDSEKHDYKAIVVVEYDFKQYFDFLYAWIRRTTIDAMLNKIFEVYLEYQLNILGIETQAFQKILVRLIEEEEKRRGIVLQKQEITQSSNKFARICKLSPYVERGYARFAKDAGAGDMDLLIEQAIYLGDVEDDGIDAGEGAFSLCKEFGRKWCKEDVSNIWVATMPSATDGFRGF